jgi:hypothetical protein
VELVLPRACARARWALVYEAKVLSPLDLFVTKEETRAANERRGGTPRAVATRSPVTRHRGALLSRASVSFAFPPCAAARGPPGRGFNRASNLVVYKRRQEEVRCADLRFYSQ